MTVEVEISASLMSHLLVIDETTRYDRMGWAGRRKSRGDLIMAGHGWQFGIHIGPSGRSSRCSNVDVLRRRPSQIRPSPN